VACGDGGAPWRCQTSKHRKRTDLIDFGGNNGDDIRGKLNLSEFL